MLDIGIEENNFGILILLASIVQSDNESKMPDCVALFRYLTGSDIGMCFLSYRYQTIKCLKNPALRHLVPSYRQDSLTFSGGSRKHITVKTYRYHIHIIFLMKHLLKTLNNCEEKSTSQYKVLRLARSTSYKVPWGLIPFCSFASFFSSRK
jgi:hypothetical protein